MNTDKTTTLINLITADLSGLNDAALAELYSIEQRLLNGSTLHNIRDIDRDTLINNFINTSQLNSSPSTIYNYRKILQDYLTYASGVLDIESLMSYLHSKVWGDNTKRRNYVLLRRFLYYLFTCKYTETDLSTHIKIPVKVKGRSFCPMSTQVKALIDSVKLIFQDESEIIRFETLLKLYIKLGLRRDELLNLNVEDIDFDRGTITIKNTKNKDTKIMNMDDNLRQIITCYLSHFRYLSGALFRGIQGNKLCRQSLMNAFNKMKVRAGVPKDFKIHSLRRFFINELRKNGIDLATIQILAGHRDIRTTGLYCNVSEEEKVKAIEKIKV